jgi:hypothetical protein
MYWKDEEPKLPMLYYKDQILGLELYKIMDDDAIQIDEYLFKEKNEYAAKMLVLFFPFRDIRFS